MSGEIGRTEFVSAYTRVLTRAWGSTEFVDSLHADPNMVLAQNGLPLPDDAQIKIVTSEDVGPDLSVKLALWNRGFSSGSFVLYVPSLPRMDVVDLSDEDLGDLAGGVEGCCCSPNCLHSG
ncbi:hypothetical protein ABZ341_34550 [Streptomyces sp. NPDC006173]|uniref:hypothetical protein n=1 Tax=Streptomyces sp. NPDC006173 TaxID=3155349 RepID=UPI0033FB1342